MLGRGSKDMGFFEAERSGRRWVVSDWREDWVRVILNISRWRGGKRRLV